MAGALWTSYDASFPAMGGGMKKRFKGGARPAKARPRKTLKRKGRNVPEGYVAVLASSPYEVRRHAEEMSDIANEHGFPLWTSLAMIFNGWSSARIGKAGEAVALLTNGLAIYRGTGH
jgi:hypothetical protein